MFEVGDCVKSNTFAWSIDSLRVVAGSVGIMLEVGDDEFKLCYKVDMKGKITWYRKGELTRDN